MARTHASRKATQLGAHKGAGASFSTIVARFPGKCKRCGGVISAGQAIRWAPKRGSWHLKDQCGSDLEAMVAYEEKYGDDQGPGEHVVTTVDGPNGLEVR